jgi:ribosome-binding protein aMBF1 (putative translation factor)
LQNNPHDIGTGIAAWYCEAAAEKGEEVNSALIVFQRTKQRSRKPKKLAAAWRRRRREINHHSTSRSVGSVIERERERSSSSLLV